MAIGAGGACPMRIDPPTVRIAGCTVAGHGLNEGNPRRRQDEVDRPHLSQFAFATR
jgi:hypothetical protein